VSFATGGEVALARPRTERALGFVLLSGLLVAAGTHLAVGVGHTGTIFGALSLGAAVAQCLLAVAVLLRPSPFVYQASIFLSLTLMQLYALNITIGLPPLMGHADLEGTHRLLGITLTLPNLVDAQGVVAQSAQLATVVSAAFLDSPD
jgi:hypothetical protein